MEVVHTRCAGVDVHKKEVVVCRLVSQPDGKIEKRIRRFETMTVDLLDCIAWLQEAEVVDMVMESTGSYWKPIWNLLEEAGLRPVLANAQHVKAMPGRKTDVKDCEWLADLFRHGLVSPSFVPDRAQRELRELTRYRTSLVQGRATEVNRLQKVLEGANCKLSSVASNVLGVSGHAILTALVAGTTDPTALAALAKGRLRTKQAELARALTTRFQPHQAFLVGQVLAHIDYLETTIEQLDAEIAERERPFEATVAQLDAIPGVGRRVAETIVAELGTTVERFPSDRHLAAWAGLSPGNNESAGKQRSATIRKGNRALTTALVEAAHSAGRTKGTYLGTLYRRFYPRIGRQRTAIAVGHSILVSVYHMLRTGAAYQDLGADYFDHLDREALKRRALRTLARLGYEVELPEPTQAA